MYNGRRSTGSLNKFITMAIVLGIIILLIIGLIHLIPYIVGLVLIIMAYKYVKNNIWYKFKRKSNNKNNNETIFTNKSNRSNKSDDFKVPDEFKNKKVVVDVEYRES
ncbi:hypothetical protein [Clostridium frigidicarnis]|nr:hypothetical protein [Clostridium frigidicarnis]